MGGTSKEGEREGKGKKVGWKGAVRKEKGRKKERKANGRDTTVD